MRRWRLAPQEITRPTTHPVHRFRNSLFRLTTLMLIAVLAVVTGLVPAPAAHAEVLLPDGTYRVTWDAQINEESSNTSPPGTYRWTSSTSSEHGDYSGTAVVGWSNANMRTTTLAVDHTHSDYASNYSENIKYSTADGDACDAMRTITGTWTAVEPDKWLSVTSTIPMFRFEPFKAADGSVQIHWPITSDPWVLQNDGNDPRYYSIRHQQSDSMPDGQCGASPWSSDSVFQSLVLSWGNELPTSITADPARAGEYVVFGDLVADSSGTTFTYDHNLTYAGREYHAHMTIAPMSVNKAPVVDAGGVIQGHSRRPLDLHGSVSDDGLPNPPDALTSQWKMVSGPDGGDVTFADPTAPATTATFSRPGHYVLQLSSSDSELSASATTTADITDTYTIRVRSWIPQPAAADPNEPIPLPYRASQLLSYFDPNCWTPPDSLISHTMVSSTFHGDNHAGFEGGFRVQDVVSFDWDGKTLSNFHTVPDVQHVGTTIRNKIYTNRQNGTVLKTCSQSGVAADTTAASSTGNGFTVTYTGKNPLTPQMATPGFVNNVTGLVQPDGSLSLNYTVTDFPSAGIQVLLNDSPIVTGRENDVSCLSDSAVLGPSGAFTIAEGLGRTATGSATAVPGTDRTFAQRSPLCP